MSSAAKGYLDGREGRKYCEPYDTFDLILAGHERNKEMCRQNLEYQKNYNKGERDRDDQ